MNQVSDIDLALDALAWQIEMGADEAIGDVPVDRLAAPEPVTTPEPAAADGEQAPIDAPAQAATAAPAKTPAPAPVPETHALTAACATLDALAAALAGFDGCDLKKGARSTVFSDGNPVSDLMIIGEAPGREEDQSGKPFVGPSGQLLDRMFAAIGRARTGETADNALYITNVIAWRPPQNRDPSPQEMALMLPFLIRHIELADPKIIVTMGNAATKSLLGTSVGITRMRGTWASFRDIPVMPMFHPAALLRDPLKKRDSWADLLEIKARQTP